MTNSIFVAAVFALAFIANLYDLIVNAPKIEDEEKRKKRTISKGHKTKCNKMEDDRK